MEAREPRAMRNQSSTGGGGGGGGGGGEVAPMTPKMKDLGLNDKDGTDSTSTTTLSSTASTELEARANPRPLPDNPELLPQAFVVKALGKRESRGLWGIKHTRGPVDDMVAAARALKPGSFLPFLQLRVARDGVHITEMPQNQNRDFEGGCYPIDVISYGVQDLVYTRVFAMIVVRDDPTAVASTAASLSPSPPNPKTPSPNPAPGDGGIEDKDPPPKPLLECHAFVCDSRQSARRLTFALATAFKAFSATVRGRGERRERARQFAIDLRSPDEMLAELQIDSEA